MGWCVVHLRPGSLDLAGVICGTLAGPRQSSPKAELTAVLFLLRLTAGDITFCNGRKPISDAFISSNIFGSFTHFVGTRYRSQTTKSFQEICSGLWNTLFIIGILR